MGNRAVIVTVSIPYRYGIYKYGKERNFKKASNVWFQFLIGMVSTARSSEVVIDKEFQFLIGMVSTERRRIY